MTCVELSPAPRERIAPSPPPATAPQARRARRARPAGRADRWWRWLAASAVLSPGGAMAYELLVRPNRPSDVLHAPSPGEYVPRR